MLGQHNLRRSERREDDVLHLERQFLHATDRVLDPRPHPVDDVEIGLEFLPKHPDRVQHPFLTIDVVMLDNGMEKRVLRRDADFARVDLHILDVLLVNLVAIFRQRHQAAVVEALDVRAGNADIDAADHHVALCLSVDHRFVHALHCRLEIDDLAFPDAARRRLADSENFDRAVRPAFADHHTDFRGANFQAHHEIAACHACFLVLSEFFQRDRLLHRRGRARRALSSIAGGAGLIRSLPTDAPGSPS